MPILVHNTRADFMALCERAAQFRLGRAYKFMRYVYPKICFVLALLYIPFIIYSWRFVPLTSRIQGIYSDLLLLAATWIWPLTFSLSLSALKRKKRFGIPFTLELREDGLHINQEGEQDIVAWSQFRHVNYDDHYLFLLRNGWKNYSYVIPDRSFSSPDEANSFSQLALDLWLQSNSVRAPIAAP